MCVGWMELLGGRQALEEPGGCGMDPAFGLTVAQHGRDQNVQSKCHPGWGILFFWPGCLRNGRADVYFYSITRERRGGVQS